MFAKNIFVKRQQLSMIKNIFAKIYSIWPCYLLIVIAKINFIGNCFLLKVKRYTFSQYDYMIKKKKTICSTLLLVKILHFSKWSASSIIINLMLLQRPLLLLRFLINIMTQFSLNAIYKMEEMMETKYLNILIVDQCRY